MMSYSNSLLFREAGSLINRPVTVRTIPRFWHPRTGFTAFLLLLSTTTELVVLNLIPQHDPQSDPELASHGQHSPSPGPSALICGGKNAATPDPCVQHAPPPHPRETATTDCLVWSTHRAAAARHWSIHGESSLHN